MLEYLRITGLNFLPKFANQVGWCGTPFRDRHWITINLFSKPYVVLPTSAKSLLILLNFFNENKLLLDAKLINISKFSSYYSH